MRKFWLFIIFASETVNKPFQDILKIEKRCANLVIWKPRKFSNEYTDLHGDSHAIAWGCCSISCTHGFPRTSKLRRGIAVPRFWCLIQKFLGAGDKEICNMKKVITICYALLCAMCSFVAVAEEEADTAYPTAGANLYRRVSFAEINGKAYSNVEVELKSAKYSYWPFFLNLFIKGVKVVVKDVDSGKMIYRKRFPDANLYVFPSGNIQVGIGNRGVSVIEYVIIWESEYDGDRYMTIEERGIY